MGALEVNNYVWQGNFSSDFGNPANWTNGFLPAAFQGTAFNAEKAITNLMAPKKSTPESEKDVREFVDLLNREHLQRARTAHLVA